MRAFEIFLLVWVGLSLLKPFSGNLRKITHLSLFVLAAWIGMALHFPLEGGRWQMIPAYALITFFTIQWQVRRMRPGRTDNRSLLAGVGGVILFAIALLPLLVFPMPDLVEPSGSYRVGTQTLYFQDPSREEIYAPNSRGNRELNVQIWYPAQVTGEVEKAPYMSHLDLSAPAFARFLRLPGFVLNHVRLIDTHSFLDAPLAVGRDLYPVLIFSHGWGGTRTQSTYLMEELASQGYVVVAPDHTYGALVTVFPDKRVVLQKSEVLEGEQSKEEFKRSAKTLIGVWAGDVRFILDQLEGMNAGEWDSIFTGRLDLARVGIFGHSTGGGNAVQVCWLDSRCRAGLALDAWLEPVSVEALDHGLEQPFMFMWSEGWGSEENQNRFRTLSANLSGDVYNLEIQGTRHYDFSDLPLLSPLSPWLGLKGPIDGQRVLRIINDYVLAYFNQTLLGMETTLLEGPSQQYPEVGFERVESSGGR